MQTRSFSMAVAALQRQLRNHATLHIMASDRTVRLLVVVTALLFLPLDFTQLAFAVTGGKGARKAPRSMKAWPPRLPGVCWEADVQLLLAQITPGAEAERAVARIVETVRPALPPAPSAAPPLRRFGAYAVNAWDECAASTWVRFFRWVLWVVWEAFLDVASA
eukprot:g18573.t1